MYIDLEALEEKRQQLSCLQEELSLVLWDCEHRFARQVNLLFHLRNAVQKMTEVQGYLQYSCHAYRDVEDRLKCRGAAFSSSKWRRKNFDFQHDFSLKNGSDLSLENLTLGIAAVGHADFALSRIFRQSTYGNFNSSIDMALGYAGVKGTGRAVLYKEGKWDPSLEVDAEARASLLQAGIRMGYQNKIWGLTGDAALDVGTAAAQVKAVISKEEISMKAECGAAAVSGKVHGRFSIFGFHVDTTLKGDVLAFGGGAEFSKGSGYVEIGGKFSLFAGLGFKIRVSRD